MGIMNVLAELHQEPDLKLNLKFEIEVLCKTLSLDLHVSTVSYYRIDWGGRMQRGSVSPLIKKHLAPFSLHPSRCYCELIFQSYFAIQKYVLSIYIIRKITDINMSVLRKYGFWVCVFSFMHIIYRESRTCELSWVPMSKKLSCIERGKSYQSEWSNFT